MTWYILLLKISKRYNTRRVVSEQTSEPCKFKMLFVSQKMFYLSPVYHRIISIYFTYSLPLDDWTWSIRSKYLSKQKEVETQMFCRPSFPTDRKEIPSTDRPISPIISSKTDQCEKIHFQFLSKLDDAQVCYKNFFRDERLFLNFWHLRG